MDQYRAANGFARILYLFAVCLTAAVLFAAPSVQAAPSAADNQSSSDQEAGQSVSLNQLADLLENDKTREALIAQLRQSADGAAGQGDSTAADQTAGNANAATDKAAALPEPAPRVSFARQFAQTTSAWSEAISNKVTTAWHAARAIAQPGSNGAKDKAKFDLQVFLQAALMFAIVVGSTVAAFLVLRWLASFMFSAIARFGAGKDEDGSSLVRRATAIFSGIVIDVIVVALAGGAGYAAGLFAVGDAGAMGTRESLFINAFMMIELVKVAIRALFASRHASLRLLNLDSAVAGWWSIRLRCFVGVVGYALLVAVPIVNEQVSLIAGAILTFVIMGAAYIYALAVIFGNRKLLTERIRDKADHASNGFFGVLYRLLARVWVILAVAYFTVLFVVSQIDPSGALPYMLLATLETLIVAAIGLGVSGIISKAIGRRLRFSDSLRERLPMLESRVNSYVPNALQVIRVLILIVVVALIANAWKVFNLGQWLSSDAGLTAVSVTLKVLIILAAAALLWLIAASVIEHRLSDKTGRGAPSARQQTLLVLFRNALAIIIATFTVMITLSQIGVNIGPLIAGAGVFGLAIGFGAQKLVQDIITGVFIQLENAMNTGDVVTVGGVTGTAERLTIRSVSIRDIDGCYHIVPFSSASVVSNYMRDWAYFRTEYGIAYREDIDNAIYYLREAFEDLKSDPTHGPNILEDMTVPGVTALADSSVNIRIMIKTKPGTQWGIGRAFNRLVKIHFDRAGIEIPYPHQTLYFGEDRQGEAPAANVRVIEESEVDHQTKPLKKRRRGDDAAPDETGDAPAE
ncbi:mechanosensitive ion channel domain-containing protein [Salinisphaera sp. Q1T1-3]|uniref:mechanosensitive ion channel domain-containing protein n=1 Tax=Salinisphaera sp. Q1T1-3 TaxID=2321229 RepID=UPI000E72E0BF|nr:mechanosensitive ion channel domain-containing protein [Salinisphaera sp. Q1T1-3]RJS93718.1 mechanosensitive channel protein [Salinisphaera sp. Q1T1-3]